MSNTAWQNGGREAGEEDPYLGDMRVAQIDELDAALELIADEHGRANKTLQMVQLEAKKQVVA